MNRCLNAIAALGILTVAGIAAELPAQAAGPMIARAAVGEDTAGRPSEPPGRAPAIVATAMPASFQVITVPVPRALASAAAVMFEIRDAGLGTMVGPRTGPVRSDTVLFTVGVPRDALAGRRTFGWIRFTADGVTETEIPIDLDVGVVRRIVLSAPRARQGAVPGSRLDLSYRATNEGNALDSVVVDVELPTGWRRLDRARPVRLAPGTTVEGRMRLALPPSVSGGTIRVPMVAMSDHGERARSTLLVDVAASRSPRRAGPRLTSGIAMLASGHSLITVAGAELTGNLTDSVRVQGRILSELTPEPVALRGLARVGYGGTPWYLSLDAPRWRADVGTIRVGYTPLTGEAASGTGASASATRGSWQGSMFGVSNAPGVRDGSAEYLGVRLARFVDSVRVGATVTHLRERSAFGRRLAAFGIDAEAPTAFGAVAAGELAYRRHDGGSGLGWATEISRRGEAGEHLRLRLASAPGGSSAFARGTRELSATASRRLSQRTSLGGSFWRSRDESSAAQRTSLVGWSLSPRVLVSDAAAVSLELGGHDFDTRSPVAGFGSGERRIGLTVDARLGPFSGATGLHYGALDRTVTITSGTAHRTMTYRTTWRGSVATGGRWGGADLYAQVEQSGSGSGYEPRRNEVHLRLQSPTLPLGKLDVAMRGEVQHYGWFGDRTSIAVVRAAADLQLPWSIRLTLDAERNPLFSAIAGGSVWSSTMRITRATAIPRLFVARAASGIVFQDLDGDGRRDPSEPGLASAIIHYGSSHRPTDERGRFAFDSRHAGTPILEVRSIPLGWIVTGTVQERDGAYTEIGVAPTSTARIRLRVDSSAELSLRVPVSLIRVSLQNDDGREWVAPVDARGSAFFDALPVGRYRIVLDLTRLPEPVTIAGETSFRVGADPAAIEHVILLRTRPVRLRRIEPPAEASDTTSRWRS